MVSRAVPVLYSTDVARGGAFWERLGFQRHYQFPLDGDTSYVGLQSDSSELAITHAAWALDRYGMRLGTRPRVEMDVYIRDLDGMVDVLRAVGVEILREQEDMPSGERIATVADPDVNPVALCGGRAAVV